eukprot:TRINITY_DN1491_c0_g1_i4.p1 TRINITY_DN1491_c0_g1~~TRINITY_DN1491_c0_g1_i4.p1  ORF type:complete len:293 (+),score=35.71 TRINITY_DN1491_c0_g1_i4:62-940(+)
MNDDSEDQSSNKSLNNKFELETSTTDTRTKHNENNDSFQASIKDILAGSFRGISQIVVGHPFDTVKVRLQTQKSITSSTTNIINNIKNQQQQQLKYSGLINCITKTFKEENILGFYKGSFSPIVGCSLYSSVLFFSWGRSKKIFEINENESSLIKLGSAGCLTGFIASFIEGPIDLIKSKMQVQYSINHNLNVITKQKNYHFERYKNSLDCIYKISSTHGIRGIFQGLTATICRNTIGTMFYFSSYEVIHQQFSVLLDTDSKSSTPLILLAGTYEHIHYVIMITETLLKTHI